MTRVFLSDTLVKQYEEFDAQNEDTAPENMAGWLRSAGCTMTETMKPFDQIFENRSLSLREELNKLADLIKDQIGEEQINAVLQEEPRENRQIKRVFWQAASLLSYATSTSYSIRERSNLIIQVDDTKVDDTKIDPGGLYRCCIKTIRELDRSTDFPSGTVIDCKYESPENKNIILLDGIWQWRLPHFLAEKLPRSEPG